MTRIKAQDADADEKWITIRTIGSKDFLSEISSKNSAVAKHGT
ncbi:MAG: hypothetical protein Q8S22_09325 [Eubacteriales bacterium]|nr:hypothetical protein [Eubacteriales bacterium]